MINEKEINKKEHELFIFMSDWIADRIDGFPVRDWKRKNELIKLLDEINDLFDEVDDGD